MADISSLRLSDNQTYYFKDNSAIVSISRSGNTYTATRHDGTTFEFTQKDDNTTYTFEDGVNSFTVTPSNGTAQTVTVTPSIPNATQSSDGLMSATDKTKLDGVANGAEVNQNAFSNIKVGSTTLAADSKTDTLEFVAGDNITLTPTEVSDKITISSSYTNTTYTLTQDATDGHKFSLEGTDGYFKEITIPDANTTYTIEADTTNNKIKLIPSSGSAVSITVPFATNATNATNATKATQDESGNNIKATYAASFSISDHTITLKNKNGTSLGTVTVPDNNTTYTFAEGTTDKAFSVTPSGGNTQTVSIHGLGSASTKDYTSSVTSGSADLVTSGAVYSAIDTAIDNLPEPMIFKGTLGTNGTISTLPTASSTNEGWTYKVITANTYPTGEGSNKAKVGDMFICAELTTGTFSWVYVPSGDDVEDTWRNIKVDGTEKLTTAISSGAVDFVSGNHIGLSFNATGNKLTIAHADTSSQASSTNSGRTYIQSIGLDGDGHVTSLSTATETVVNTDRYVNSAAFDYDSTNDNIKMTLTRAGSDSATVVKNIPKVSSSTAGVVPKGTAVSSQSQNTKFLREDGTWAKPSYTTNTNTTYTIGTSGNTVTLTPSSGSVQSITVPFATNATNATKATQDANGDVIATTYRKLSNNDFDTINATEVNAGDLIVTGVGRFTNGLYGDLSGTATKVSNSLKIQLNGGTTEGTNQFTYDGSAAKTVNVTKSAIGLGNVDNTADANKSVASANTAGSATKATQDESGNNIKATYAASFSISDHTITLKNKNGVSLGTVTVPDNATDNTKLPLAGGTMTGQIILASSALKTNESAGWTMNQYGNLVHQRATTTDYWAIANNAGTYKFQVYYETGAVTTAGNVTAPKFIGNLQGDADTWDGYHCYYDRYKYTYEFTQPTADTIWYVKIATANWNSNLEIIQIRTEGNNKTGSHVLHTGSRGTSWWGYGQSYGHRGVIGVRKSIGNADNVYLKLEASCTRCKIYTSFEASAAEIVTDTSTSYTTTPENGGFYGNVVTVDEFVGNLTGNATSATTASKLGSSNVGSATQPIYLSAGTATACTYTLGKSVPSDAVFTDTKVTQTAVTASSYTNWRPLVIGSSNSATEGFVPSSVTDTTITASTISCQPSSGTIKATTFKGNATSATSATKATQDSDGNTINTTYVKQSYIPTVLGTKSYGGSEDNRNKKIKIKINPTKLWMLCFTVTLYQNYKSTKVMISGYNYDAYHWHAPNAKILGSSETTAFNVYFGYDANKELWVGFDGDLYTAVTVDSVTNGYQQISDYKDMFTISFVDELTTLQTTQTIYRPYYRDETVANATNATNATSATTASRVSATAGTADANRHVWFSDGSTETARCYDDDFKYNPSTNVLTVSSITGSAAKLGTSNVGSATNPIYLASGTATACTYSLNKTVPSDAVFTDQYVSQSATTTSDYRKIVLSYQNGAAGAAVTSNTNVVYVTANAEVQPSTGNIRSAGTVSAANLSATTNVNGVSFGVATTSGTTGGISLYNGAGYVTSYGLAMRTTSNGGKHGYVQGDWGTYFYMAGATNRGWVFVNAGSGNRASISTEGNMVLNGSLTLGGNTTNTSGVRQVYNSTTKSLDFVFVA